MSARMENRVSSEEYLRLERLAESRSECFDGEIIPMPGVTRQHNRINRNLIVELDSRLADRTHEIFFCEMRVKVGEGSYAYPDIAIPCDNPLFEDDFVDTLLNPTVIIEILSKSTEALDRGRKLQQYRSIDSLQEYFLVSQTECRIERYARQNSGEWLYSDTTGRDQEAEFRSLSCRIPLERIYAGIGV